ncbi:MAG: tetratricopeptide repeat protein [Methanoregulaceae archaeon]
MKIGKQTQIIIGVIVIVVIAAVGWYAFIQKPLPTLSEDNLDAINHYNTGNSMAMEGKYEDALNETEKALAINSNFPPAWVQKADALNHLGQYSEAVNATSRALSLNSTDNSTKAMAWAVRADALNNLGLYEQAIVASNTALQLEPELPMAATTKSFAQSMLAMVSNGTGNTSVRKQPGTATG